MVAIPMIKSHASDVMYVSYSKKIYRLPYNTVLLGRGYIFCYERNTYCHVPLHLVMEELELTIFPTIAGECQWLQENNCSDCLV